MAPDIPPALADLLPEGWRLSISMGPDLVIYAVRRRMPDGRVCEVRRSASQRERRAYSPGPLALDLFYVVRAVAELAALA